MRWTAYSRPVYSSADNTTIDCLLTIDGVGTVPFTASARDFEPWGPQVFTAIEKNAATTPIGPYVPPVTRDLTTGTPPQEIG